VDVTSVSKRVQRLSDVAASVFVISAEDIRRSGATSLPEALRLAPNLQVARADANQYAITARGFNAVLANKMLVLIDGRTAYSPLFSGVFWEAQDVVLEDVERIEVLSGSGGTLYGSNAVNGVINIIMRSASDTHGLLVAAGGGSQDNVETVRYGGETGGGASYRVYGRHSGRDNTAFGNGTPIRDASARTQVGFRTDWPGQAHSSTLQGDFYESRIEQAPAGNARRISGFNLLGRHARQLDDGASAQVQVYYDRTNREQPGALNDTLDTLDAEFQHQSRPTASQQLLWGAG
jgi:iron complex outermembrane receptor protein